MVKAGLTPAEAIVAATRNAANILGATDLGTIAPGKSADFLVLDANPLDNIANTRKIASVYLRGLKVDRVARAAARQTAGTPAVYRAVYVADLLARDVKKYVRD
jgi:adenine deaminase